MKVVYLLALRDIPATPTFDCSLLQSYTTITSSIGVVISVKGFHNIFNLVLELFVSLLFPFGLQQTVGSIDTHVIFLELFTG